MQNIESMRSLGNNLKEVSESLLEKVDEAECRELEKALSLNTFPIDFKWKLDPGQPSGTKWFLYGPPKSENGRRVLNFCSAKAERLGRSLNELYKLSDVVFSSNPYELFIYGPREEIIKFLTQNGVKLENADEMIEEIQKREKESNFLSNSWNMLAALN